jgi:hypothetical protein
MGAERRRCEGRLRSGRLRARALRLALGSAAQRARLRCRALGLSRLPTPRGAALPSLCGTKPRRGLAVTRHLLPNVSGTSQSTYTAPNLSSYEVFGAIATEPDPDVLVVRTAAARGHKRRRRRQRRRPQPLACEAIPPCRAAAPACGGAVRGERPLSPPKRAPARANLMSSCLTSTRLHAGYASSTRAAGSILRRFERDAAWQAA